MTQTNLFHIELPRVVELVVSAGITAILTMGYLIYVGRVLGPEEYADFAASLSMIYFVGVALSPLTPAVARLCARYTARRDRHAIAALRRQIISRVASAALVLAVIGATASPVLASFLKFRSTGPLIVAFGVVLLYAIVSVDRGVVHGLLEFRVHNVNTMAEAVVRWGCAAALFVVWRSATAGMTSYLIALITAELALAIRFQMEPSDATVTVDWEEVRSVTVPIVILMIAVAAFQNTDMLVVKRFFPPVASGAYGAATALARAIAILFVPLYVMAGPILSGLHESGQPVFGATMRLTAIFVALTAVPLLAMAGASDSLVSLLYGRDFIAAAHLLAPLAGVAVITCTTLMLSQALITLGDYRFLVAYSSLAVVQIMALIRFHGTFREILTVLYAVQGVLLLIVAVFFFGAGYMRGARV